MPQVDGKSSHVCHTCCAAHTGFFIRDPLHGAEDSPKMWNVLEHLKASFGTWALTTNDVAIGWNTRKTE